MIVVALATSVTGAGASTPASINPGQIPTGSAGFPQDCGQETGWVFVLPASQGSAFVRASRDVPNLRQGAVAGTVAANDKAAVVNAPLTDTLLATTAQIDGGHEGFRRST